MVKQENEKSEYQRSFLLIQVLFVEWVNWGHGVKSDRVNFCKNVEDFK